MKTHRKFYIVAKAKAICEEFETGMSDEDFSEFMFRLLLIVDEQVQKEKEETDAK